MGWISEHWAEIGVGVLFAIRVLEAYVSVTETKADDEFVAKLKEAAKHVFGLTSHKK